jgi:Zn-finger nucleic acid-binding protein
MGCKEFHILHEQFSKIYNKIQKEKPRKRAIGGGRQGVIRDTKSKLLFILMYVKVYPTFDLAGALFGVVASRPCEWVNEYLAILETALGRHCVLPARKINSIEEFKRICPGVQEVILDGGERPIQRPKNNKNQKKAYSGKKKRHTRKNIYLTNREKKILYLSPTKS